MKKDTLFSLIRFGSGSSRVPEHGICSGPETPLGASTAGQAVSLNGAGVFLTKPATRGGLLVLLQKVREKLRHRLMILWLIDRLRPLGLEVMPYYVILEDPRFVPPLEREPEGYSFAFLTREELAQLDHIDGRERGREELEQWFEQGRLCAALKKGDRVAVFTWVDLREFVHDTMRARITDDEAYLFDTHTVRDFRGSDLAGCLRRKIYEALGSRGKRRFYNITECFNYPSLRFKEKLGGRTVKLCLYVNLLRRRQFHWVLRDYTGEPGGGRPMRR